CKVTPALFLPYFLWKRSWNVLAGAALGMVLFVWLIPAAAFGWDRNQEFLHSWWDTMVVPFAIEGKVTTEHQNQSLPGFMNRMLTTSPSFGTYDERGQYVVLERHNVADWDPQHVRWLLKGCMALFALAVVWRCRAPVEPRPSWRLMAEFSI